jgi:carboxylesterase type B
MTGKVTTTCGDIRGFMGSNGIYTFLGIPYGADTSGDRRFLPPMEVPFIFRNLEATPIVGTREDRFKLADIMSDTWVTFARSGNPNHSALPEWEPYDLERRATMLLDVPPRLEADPWGGERLAWKETPVKLPWEGEVFVTAMPGR